MALDVLYRQTRPWKEYELLALRDWLRHISRSGMGAVRDAGHPTKDSWKFT
jgi:hypothetical protein